MALVPENRNRPSSLPLSLRPINGALKLRAYNQSDVHVGVSAENDGTLRMQLIGSDDQGTTQRYVDTEATGELRISNIGWNGSALTRFLLETTGELKSVVHGKDSGGNIDALRTNANQQLQVEVIDALGYEQIDPQLVPAAEADLWDPGGAAGDKYDVEFLVVNVDGTNAVDVSVGQDVAGAGGLTAARYFMYTESVPAKGSSGWRGPFRIGGDDHIRGVATAADDAAIHFRARKVQSA